MKSSSVVRMAVLVFVVTLGVAARAVQFGVNPYGNILGTGSMSSNGMYGASSAQWHDLMRTAPYQAYPTVLYYEERWTTPQDFDAIFLTRERVVGGTIMKAVTPGGAFDTAVESFSFLGAEPQFLHASTANGGGAYGVRVEVNVTKNNDYFQMADMEFLAQDPGANIALGATTIYSSPAWSAYGTGEVTDGNLVSARRAPTTGTEAWVGWEFPEDASQWVRALRVSSSYQHGAAWGWHNFNLQVKQNGVWNDLGQASLPSTEEFHWINFETDIEIQGVRLYGSDLLGNNPVRSGGGLIIDDIFAYAGVNPIPEPATAVLAAAGALVLLRRRSPRG
ncbi:MAG: hypothetical protein BWZ02_00658 [Lentisphaerae bacterium ADurb.BinA184]|nr:MAG: hypothetical protein BWZ02_00658 [Lentisphaerae bacterium ADurb.BinA184]